MDALYAVDYGVRAENGDMIDMDLRPLLDLVAATYDGCRSCVDRHVAVIADQPALSAHTIGVALRTITDVSEAPAYLVMQKLDPHGAAIALTMRQHGLRAAVELAAAMTTDNRRHAVAVAAGKLQPTQWYDTYLSNYYDSGPVRGTTDDTTVLQDLRADGYVPTQ